MYKKINDYAILGNQRTVALVGLDGSIDWLCLPDIDSPSVFGALLDDEKGGRFAIAPEGPWDSVAAYLPDTNILQTRFRTRSGELEVTDFMPVVTDWQTSGSPERAEMYRRVAVRRGTVAAAVVFEPRFDYARADTRLEQHDGVVIAHAGTERLTLRATFPIGVDGGRGHARWPLAEGESVWLHLCHGGNASGPLDTRTAEAALTATEKFWRDWVNHSETGRAVDLGPYASMVGRSALVLKLLYYEPTGAIAAAATTSLPEAIGGVRNWDYRYTWIRDTSFTLQALFNLGHLSETHGYLKWVQQALRQHGASGMQIMYGLRGEAELPERELGHLDGYKGSRPVRIGNGAARQRQLDIFGEIMDAALKLSDYVGKIDVTLWPLLCGICDYVTDIWVTRDSGIWEVRNGPFHFVYSKVMCWVALDRGITIARRYGFAADLNRWESVRAAIKDQVLERGWNARRGAFVQHYDSDALDAVNLLIPHTGFLPFDDPRVVSTIEATERELEHHGFLHRYHAPDGLTGDEGSFLLCTFWLIDCLIGLGRLEDADTRLRHMERTANHVGLFAEEYDARWQEALGNFPQAFTHIGYINTVIALRRAQAERRLPAADQRPALSPLSRYAVWRKVTLNAGEPRLDMPLEHIGARLKASMNVLRGAFFDTKRGRVAYEAMRKSRAYAEYTQLACLLQAMDLSDLRTRPERVAFWINLYNVIVIHAVVEFGVRDSVREVTNFFRRARYNVDGYLFTPDDIEHGILRGNRRPPYRPFRLFRRDDPRRAFVNEDPDPRIHFALVCASSSCPPIEFYTADNIDNELDIAAGAFLNGGGVRIERQQNRVRLSQIFRWYAADFGRDRETVLRRVARYLYNDDERKFLETNAGSLQVDYLDYDWRLNRY